MNLGLFSATFIPLGTDRWAPI